MDRLSFINQSNLNNTVSCGSDDCECADESMAGKEELRKIKPLHLLAITVMAFVCAAAFLTIKRDMVNAGMLRDKGTRSIACGPGRINDEGYIDHRKPADRNTDRNNGSSCPHQLGMQSLICDSKRKKNHTC